MSAIFTEAFDELKKINKRKLKESNEYEIDEEDVPYFNGELLSIAQKSQKILDYFNSGKINTYDKLRAALVSLEDDVVAQRRFVDRIL